MRIKEKRFLRGPNLYAASPCLLAVIDAHTRQSAPEVPGFAARLLALLPGLSPEASARLSDGAGTIIAVEPVMMELQRLCGAPGPLSQTIAAAGKPGLHRIVCGYSCEQVAGEALALSLALVDALARGADFAFDDALAELRRTAARHAIGTSTGAVLDAAHRRGIPSLRLTDDANLFQLGWGSKQKRLQATLTGATNSIAVSIASDKQLTKTLLDQAGVPVPAGSTVTSLAEAQRVARRLGGPVTIKPLDANQGKGVTTTCTTPEEVQAAFEFARQYGRHIIVEQFLPGRDYRVLVTGAKRNQSRPKPQNRGQTTVI
jgi:cyanophycin synthetase